MFVFLSWGLCQICFACLLFQPLSPWSSLHLWYLIFIFLTVFLPAFNDPLLNILPNHFPQRIVVQPREMALAEFRVDFYTDRLFEVCCVFLSTAYSKGICYMQFYLFLLICIFFWGYMQWFGFMHLPFFLGYLEFSISSFNSLKSYFKS